MTDSGYSSAASARSSSSILKPSFINKMSDMKRPMRTVLGTHNSNIPISEGTNLPKPSMQSTLGRPIIPNRLLYGQSHGGYSPVGSPLCSFSNSNLSNCLSPMSSLALDFCDLNTSQETANTPRRKLSLSSVSSVDSPRLFFNGSARGIKSGSPLSNSINNAFNTYQNSLDCSTPLSLSSGTDKENVFPGKPLQRCQPLPGIKFNRQRLVGTNVHDKENVPINKDQFSPILSPSPNNKSSPSPCKPSPMQAQIEKDSVFSISSSKKRFRDENASSAFSMARKRSKCSVSFIAKSAFSKERKTKSANAILTRPVPVIPSSPVSQSTSVFSRSMSAPPQPIPDDDDIVLSHSSLCSGDSDDEGKHDVVSSSNGSSEESDSFIDAAIGAIATPSPSRDAPTGIDGLISGKLLFSNNNVSKNNDSMDSSITSSNQDLKPRELFRSPSAPPLTSSRRSLLATKRAVVKIPCDRGTPVSYKRRKSVANFGSIAAMENKENEEAVAAACLNRSRSANDFDIMRAVEQGCSDNNLVGDFSRKCTIPTVLGRHQDLKYITRETMFELLQDKNSNMDIVDCRYTYEYQGGHIIGAVNIWTESQMQEEFFDVDTVKQIRKGNIIVFHCEFSSERAPKMARALRNYDRSVNHYPHLNYPEIYVLHSGYKAFYQTCKDYCEPRNYVPMLDKKYEAELRKFRVKSKTWAGEKSKHGLIKRLQHHR